MSQPAFLPSFISSHLCPFSASWQCFCKILKTLIGLPGNSHGSKLTSTFWGAWYCSIPLLVPKAVFVRACFLSVLPPCLSLSLVIENVEESDHMVVELTNPNSAGQAGKVAVLAVIVVVVSSKVVWGQIPPSLEVFFSVFYCLQLFGWGPPTSWRIISFTWSLLI